MRRALATLAFGAAIALATHACGQQVPDIAVEPSPGAPPAGASPAAAAIDAAIAAARAELAELEAAWSAEATELHGRIDERTHEVGELSDREIALRRELAALGEELVRADERRLAAVEEKTQRESGFEALGSELRSQAYDLRERFQTSLLAIADPALLAPLEPVIGQEGEPEAHIDGLIGVYEAVLAAAECASRFDTTLRLPNRHGEVTEGAVLQLGLLGGYYSAGGESGFVVSPSELGEKPEGRSHGIAPEQQAAIAALIADPARGGAIPIDVTGGAGLATLELGDDLDAWFEKGGFFMWPLLAAAGFAALMILERIVVLSLRTRGIAGHLRRTLSLIEAGRSEEALRYATRIRGPAGPVLSAALVHSDRDRSVIEDAVQEALLHVQPVFSARLGLISLLAAVAPLLGLLGTVTGMITTFNMVTIFGSSDPRFLAGGISEALITTEAGLYLAIPCLLFRGALGAFADSALAKLEAGTMSVVLALLKARGGSVTPVVTDAQVATEDAPMAMEDTPKPKAIPRVRGLTRAAKLPRGNGSGGVPAHSGRAEIDLDDVGTESGEAVAKG